MELKHTNSNNEIILASKLTLHEELPFVSGCENGVPNQVQ